MAQRIKGQEVQVLLVQNGVPLDSITAIRDFEFNYQLEIKSEGYLGETANRKDTVYNGIAGKMSMHFESKSVFTLFQSIVDTARRRTPGTKINIKATLAFPNGDRVRVIIPDAQFGEIPVSFGGRTEYGMASLTYEAVEAQTISA